VLNFFQCAGFAMTDNQFTHEIIGAAIEVHKRLGPSLLESAYEICLEHEMHLRNLKTDRQVGVPVVYREQTWIADIALISLSNPALRLSSNRWNPWHRFMKPSF
jgi:hypothetical protein